jgi:8-oxo-dGTP pyrophosphatase MutT (NUDIX family)
MAPSTHVEGLREGLRRVLLTPAEAAAISVPGRIDAAVLVPLYLTDGEIHVVFTKRHDELRRHAGEISFPGGRRDESERDLRQTALREAQEEIGLEPHAVEIVGALQPTPTIATGYAIYPFVGMIEAGFAWVVAHAEVAEVLELRLEDLRAGYGERRLVRRGIPFRTPTYEAGGHVIWGATARILADLLVRVSRSAR